MINYVEKGEGLHNAIKSAGHSLRQEFPSGEWVSSDDVAVQAIIDSYDPFPEMVDSLTLKINAKRDQILTTNGFIVDGHRFHSDTYSATQQIGLTLMASQMKAAGATDETQLPLPPWKTMDNGYVQLTVGMVLQFIQNAGAMQSAFFQAGATKKAEVQTLADNQDLEGLQTYDVEAGWPEV
jgi:hypothetical protein